MQEVIQRKRLTMNKWDSEMTNESRQNYKEMQCKAKIEVVKAKQRVYDELHKRLDSEEA